MCKPQKTNGINPDKEVGHIGFSKIKALIHSKDDLAHYEAELEYTDECYNYQYDLDDLNDISTFIMNDNENKG